VSSGRPSVETFLLSLSVSEIPGIAAFVPQHATFLHPTFRPSHPKISLCFPGSKLMWMGLLWATKSEGVALIVRAVIISKVYRPN